MVDDCERDFGDGFFVDVHTDDLNTHFFRGLSPGSSLAIHAPAIPSDREEFGLFNHNTVEVTDSSRVQLGLRWFTTIGPLRVDLAYPLNPDSSQVERLQFYISLGQAF